MLEAVDKVAEEHERNTRLFMLLLTGLRALETGPPDAAAVAESFLLKLMSLSGFHPSLTACAVCGRVEPQLFSAGQGGAVCSTCADHGAGPVSTPALGLLAELARSDMAAAGATVCDPRTRGEARALLYGFAEYHIERRIRSLPILARSLAP